jgi:hypothetical protein
LFHIVFPEPLPRWEYFIMNKPLLKLPAQIATLALLGAIASCSGGGDRDSADRDRINPAGYRSEIETVEKVLYKQSPVGYGDAEAVADGLIRLHESIAEREMNPIARSRATGLLYLSSRADIGEAGFVASDLGPIRTEWETLRAELFQAADWLAKGDVGLASVQRAPVPSADRQDLQALEHVIDRLARLIDEGRQACEELGEPEYDAEMPGPSGRRHIASWNEWSDGWTERVDDAAVRLPSQPPWTGEREYSMAYQEVSSAIRELRLVPNGTGMWATPFRSQWEQRFATASHHLNEARRLLSDIVR